MKKSTGILFLVALVLAGVAYFYEWKRPQPKDDTAKEGAHPTFDVRQEDIRQVTVTRAGMTMVFDLKSDGWHISQPISSLADQAALGDLVNTLSIVPEDRTISNVSAADMNSYGLVNPTLSVEFKTQNGSAHKLQIGGKDFSNLEVYAFVDGEKDVALISNIIVSTIDKPLQDFRNHSVMALNPAGITSFELDNETGVLSAQQDDAGWKFVKPIASPGSIANISDLFGNLGMAVITTFVSDNPNDRAKYGLDKPAIRLRATLADGSMHELIIGKKEGDQYDAQDTSQPTIFLVQESTRTLLNQSFSDLRAKALFAGPDETIARVEVHNKNGVTVCAKDSTGALTIQQPAAQAGAQKAPAPACPDFMSGLERAASPKIYDQPPAPIADKLAKPAIEVIITDQSGKKTDLQISDAAGNPIYGRSSAGPSIYEFDKGSFDALDYNPGNAK